MIRTLFTALFFTGVTATVLALPCLAQTAAPAASAAASPRQDLKALRSVAEQFLLTQAAGLPGEVSVKVGAVDPRTALANCPAPEAFLQPGARAWGKTTVGVRCTAPSAWTIYIQAQVNVKAEYVAAAVPLAQGQAVEQGQLMLVKGDLASMPNGIVTDMAQAI